MKKPKALNAQSNFPEVSFSYDASQSELDIIDLADLQRRSVDLSPPPDTPHRLKFNMLVFIFRGEGHHLVDFEKVRFTSASVIFLNKGQVQAFDFSSKLRGRAVLFTDSFIDSLESHMRLPFHLSVTAPGEFAPQLTLTSALKKSMESLLNELHLEKCRSDPDNAITQALFTAVLVMLMRARESLTSKSLRKSDAQKLLAFHALIEKHYPYNKDANFYSDLLNMTYKTLNQLCKKTSGKTAKYLIDQHVILEAKRRLAIDRNDITTVSFQLGFDEPTNFTKFFKRHTGITPKQFQQ